MSTFFSSRKGTVLLLAVYILLTLAGAFAVWQETTFRQSLPVMDAIGLSDSRKFRACVAYTVSFPQAPSPAVQLRLVDENVTYSSEQQQWVYLDQPFRLSGAYATVGYNSALRLPQRGDIIEFYVQYVQEMSPPSYGRLADLEILGRASDELLAECDAEWD